MFRRDPELTCLIDSSLAIRSVKNLGFSLEAMKTNKENMKILIYCYLNQETAGLLVSEMPIWPMDYLIYDHCTLWDGVSYSSLMQPLQSFIFCCAISKPICSDSRTFIIYCADFASFIIDACKPCAFLMGAELDVHVDVVIYIMAECDYLSIFIIGKEVFYNFVFLQCTYITPKLNCQYISCSCYLFMLSFRSCQEPESSLIHLIC